jgi:hypothetical protein
MGMKKQVKEQEQNKHKHLKSKLWVTAKNIKNKLTPLYRRLSLRLQNNTNIGANN